MKRSMDQATKRARAAAAWNGRAVIAGVLVFMAGVFRRMR
jgi:hypothetical protein